ncbi:MAG: hypothetical protein KF832_26775 [Caldilineaceae bacterium]|nr:hypothetical protein [Caldilineaceae bacterium]
MSTATELCFTPATELAAAIRQRPLSPVLQAAAAFEQAQPWTGVRPML